MGLDSKCKQGEGCTVDPHITAYNDMVTRVKVRCGGLKALVTDPLIAAASWKGPWATGDDLLLNSHPFPPGFSAVIRVS